MPTLFKYWLWRTYDVGKFSLPSSCWIMICTGYFAKTFGHCVRGEPLKKRVWKEPRYGWGACRWWERRPGFTSCAAFPRCTQKKWRVQYSYTQWGCHARGHSPSNHNGKKPATGMIWVLLKSTRSSSGERSRHQSELLVIKQRFQELFDSIMILEVVSVWSIHRVSFYDYCDPWEISPWIRPESS